MKLVIATQNPGKLAEFKLALSRFKIEIVSAKEVGIDRLPEENGSSYEENALMKAAYTTMKSKLPCLADDSGLEVAVLGGAPGIYSARYGGKMTSGERMAYLLDQLKFTPNDKRDAKFACSLVFTTPRGLVQGFWGECPGQVLYGPRGQDGFGYDPIFYSPEIGKTFAEASEIEKLRVSHRGKAIAQFIHWLRNPQQPSNIPKEPHAVTIKSS